MKLWPGLEDVYPHHPGSLQKKGMQWQIRWRMPKSNRARCRPLKNKWKVHGEMPPVEWRVCPENTDSLILFERIQVVKQFSEKRHGGHRGRVNAWGQNSSSCGYHFCAHWREGSGSLSSISTEICILTMSTLSAEILAGVTYLTWSRSCAPALRDKRILSSDGYRLSLWIILHIWEIMWSDAKLIYVEGWRRFTLFIYQCTILTVCYPVNAEWRLRRCQFKCRFLIICQRGKWHACKLNC